MSIYFDVLNIFSQDTNIICDSSQVLLYYLNIFLHRIHIQNILQRISYNVQNIFQCISRSSQIYFFQVVQRSTCFCLNWPSLLSFLALAEQILSLRECHLNILCRRKMIYWQLLPYPILPFAHYFCCIFLLNVEPPSERMWQKTVKLEVKNTQEKFL